MTDERNPFDTFANMTGSVVAENVEQARKAMNNYLEFLKTNLSALPGAQTDQAKQLMQNTQQNVTATFDFVEKLTKVKSIQDVLKIQAEFVQKQVAVLTEQAKDLGEAATKTATSVFKGEAT